MTEKDEFARIQGFFAPLARGHQAALNMRDDVALVDIPAGHQLVVSADMLTAGVHFRGQDGLNDVARKSLRVNLSDLAGKGATPLGYFLSLCWPRGLPESEMQIFANGLEQDGEDFNISLLGGDLIAGETGLTIAITVLGSVIAGTMTLREGARVDDDVYVSGSIGDSALGLLLLEGRQSNLSREEKDYLQQRYLLPSPRLALGRELMSLVNAGMDISDGLFADLGHLCSASGVGAELLEEKLPLSSAACKMIAEDCSLREQIFSGGDDYELLFSASPKQRAAIRFLGKKLDTSVNRIGSITLESGIRILDAKGRKQVLSGETGYRHF